jgi:uncharacterized membrane protein
VTELVLAQGYTFTHLFLTVILAWIITAFFYRRTFTSLTRKRFFTILLFRLLSIAVVVMLLFRPMLQYTKEQTQKKSIVFAVDTSSSMGISDSAGFSNTSVGGEQEQSALRMEVRLNQAKEKIKNWSEKLNKDFLLHLIEFSDKATNLQDVSLAAGLTAKGTSTSLSSAVSGLTSVMDGKKKVPAKEIEAFFLFSDGQHNTVRKPEEDAKTAGVPIYAIGVGTGLKSNSSFKDVQATDIRIPERITLKNKTRITAGIDAVGLEGRTVKVILEEDTSAATESKRGQKQEEAGSENPPATKSAPANEGTTPPASESSVRKIGEKELLLDALDGAQDVMFEFKPEKVGRTLYIVRVEPLGDEAIKENNERQTAAMVVEPGIRVFYIEGTQRAEYGAITERFLSKDPDLEFCAMVRNRSNMFERRTNIDGLQLKGLPSDQETIDSFDVFIIGDIDSSFFKPEIQEMIVKRVNAGAGLAMLGGYHSLAPGGYSGTPIGKILPVMLGNRPATSEEGQFSEPFMPKLTPDGIRNTVFANISDFFPSSLGNAKKEGLLPLAGCTRVLAPAAGATVLATCPNVKVPAAGGGDIEMPVLSFKPVGEGRAAVFTADTTRRWQQVAKALNQESPFMQFWGQFIRFLASRESAVLKEAGISAAVNKAYFEPQETVAITATVKNAEGEGTEKATVEGIAVRPDGKEDKIKLEPVAGTPGKYSGNYEPNSIGQHGIKVAAKIDALQLTAPEKIIIDVGRPNMEFDRLDLNEDLMTKIADVSGGRYAHITTADFIIDQLNRDVTKRNVVEQVPLAPPFMFWLVFVVLLTIEWVLRRKYHLR